MNRMRWLVVMCVCFGLAAGSYLVGCCDDDDGLSCEEAVDQFLSEDCQTEALAAGDVLGDCFVDCAPLEDEAYVDCTDECLNDFVDATPACGNSGETLVGEGSDCDECFLDCGEVFVTCLPGGDGEDCVDSLIFCVDYCAYGIPM